MSAVPTIAAQLRRRPLGFTLIEVLVALIIVAFGMSAVFVALTSAANSTMRLREKSFAEWVGFNQLSTVRLSASAPLVGTSEGDAVFAGIRWHCLQTIENMQIPGLLRVTIQVRYADAKGGAQVGSPSTQSGAGASDSALAGSSADSTNATSFCIKPGVGGGTTGTGGSGNWLATVVGFYGVGTLVTAPVGVLTWDTGTNGNSTPTAPAPTPASSATSSSTGAPTPAPAPVSTGTP